MKNKLFILPAIVSIAGLLFFGCETNREKEVTDAKENVEQANQELKDAQAQYESEWQQFKYEAELKIAANEKRIEELKAEIKTAGKKFKAEYINEVWKLEQKNIELKKKISEYKYEGKDKWEEFKQEFNDDMEGLGNAVRDIFTKND